jgi:hypothetical protein
MSATEQGLRARRGDASKALSAGGRRATFRSRGAVQGGRAGSATEQGLRARRGDASKALSAGGRRAMVRSRGAVQGGRVDDAGY